VELDASNQGVERVGNEFIKAMPYPIPCSYCDSSPFLT
jgi:hypothetical protein